MKLRRAFIAGVGMTPFTKPGKSKLDYPEMGAIACRAALKDCSESFEYSKVQAAVCGFVYSESTSGNRVCYELGMTGIPIMNVNNNCATGSTALHLAYQLVRGGNYDCVLALGFEKMQPGSLRWGTNPNSESPMQRFFDAIVRGNPDDIPNNNTLANPYMFAMVAKEHMKKYGSTKEHFAAIGVKNHKHSIHNPYSQFREEYTLEQVLNSPVAHDPLTRLQCSPTSDGAAAAIIVSEEFAKKHGIHQRAVELLACDMATDRPESWSGESAADSVGYSVTKRCAQGMYSKTGISPHDIQVIELHDCFSSNELITYEALGLCEQGKGHHLIANGETTHGGKWLVNPSGGLISKGHPLGATGLAQAFECTSQVRGEAGLRQRKDCEIAMSMNFGMGSAVVTSLYRMGNLC